MLQSVSKYIYWNNVSKKLKALQKLILRKQQWCHKKVKLTLLGHQITFIFSFCNLIRYIVLISRQILSWSVKRMGTGAPSSFKIWSNLCAHIWLYVSAYTTTVKSGIVHHGSIVHAKFGHDWQTGCAQDPHISYFVKTGFSKAFHPSGEVAFSALMLLGGQQEGYLACKSLKVKYLHGYVRSEVQMICIWSSWCHCLPIISCFIKIQNSLPFWCWLTQVVL